MRTKENKKGISLIVLIVTIIVVIILAAVVILTLSKNNPIESAKEARFKEDVRTFQDELALSVSKDYTNKAGQRDDKFTATKFEKINEYIPSFNENYKGKFVIKNDTLVYNEDKLNENELSYVSSLNINKNTKSGAEIVEDNPQNMYGVKVNYITGNAAIDNDITGWKIFYSDGSNVYIIASSYISYVNIPEKNGIKPSQENPTTYPKAIILNNLFNLYTGSSNIIDENIQNLNNDYFSKGYSSTSQNMREVAYMLDKDIWNDFLNSSVAEYAVGGPSVEMTLKSYSQKNNVDYRARASSSIGYEISNDGGKENTWTNSYNRMIDPNDSLYVIQGSTTENGAYAMWLSSPSGNNGSHVMYLNNNGNLSNTSGGYYQPGIGLRPLICLRSNVMLKWNEQDQIYEIELQK